MNTRFTTHRSRLMLSKPIQLRRGLAFGIIILTALFSFEVFNYSTTDYALTDMLGDLRFLGIRWATILSIAFCGIDFAGIARLFTPEEGANEPAEVWYLFGAWLLAAAMNALLTWWGVSLAILNHDTLGNALIAREKLLKIVPVFVAIMVWLIRVLIIGTISLAGDRLFSQMELQSRQRWFPALSNDPLKAGVLNKTDTEGIPSVATSRTRPAPKPIHVAHTANIQPEPTYHSLNYSTPLEMKRDLSNHLSQKHYV